MKITTMKGILLFPLIICSTGYTASFDCKNANSDVEKMICSDYKLNRLDDLLSQNYKIAINSGMSDSIKFNLKKTQVEWLDKRNACNDSKCIERMYSQRIDYLWDICFENIRGRINYVRYSEALEKINKEISQASSSNMISDFLAKNRSQIDDLGFSQKQLKSGVFIELGAYTRYSTLEEYLSLMYELPDFRSLDKINYKNYVGFRIKLTGQPYSGFVLREEGNELYLAGVISGDEVIEAVTSQDTRRLSSIFMSYSSYVLNKNKFKP
ncbi:lysozyme inhibitor LprI family protein [Salmonella enterica]|nr:lysozyme inhibitor LprI family protein [Salmonella enterica]